MASIALETLLERACPSIRYRIYAEILGVPPSSLEMAALQNQILQDRTVKEVLSWQQLDGWLGVGFHGAKGIEAGIRILSEKGVQRSQPVLAGALEALEHHPERLEEGIGKVGKVLDEKGLGGSHMIRAAVFAYAGVEEKPFVQEQIAKALAGFKAVLGVEKIDDMAELYKGQWVFKPGVLWPGIYHLRILAFTQSWRMRENKNMLAEAIHRLMELSPLPDIHARQGSQLMAPASFAMQDFAPDFERMDAAHWMMAFHRLECLARLGVLTLLPALKAQVDHLSAMLDAEGWFTMKLVHPYFTHWGAYTGLMLEPVWRDPHRLYDLTFRCELILHYGQGE